MPPLINTAIGFLSTTSTAMDIAVAETQLLRKNEIYIYIKKQKTLQL